MLATARQKMDLLDPNTQARVSLVPGDMRDFRLHQRFKLITAPFRAFMHLLTAEDQLAALTCIRRHLTAGGRWVFNIFDPRPEMLAEVGPAAGVLRKDSDFVEPRTGHRFVVWYNRAYHPLSQIVEQEFWLEELDDRGRVLARSHSPLAFRCTFRHEMRYLLEMSGFQVEALYGDFGRGPFAAGGEQIWVTRRT
jgi:hypothetical protein